MTERTVYAENEEIRYVAEKKKIRNIYLRVRSDGTVYVTAPYRVSGEFLDAFVKERIGFIRSARDRIQKEKEKNILLQPLRDGDVFCLFGEEITLRIRKADEEKTTFGGGVLYLDVQNPYDSEKVRKRWESFMTDMCRDYFPSALSRMRSLLSDYRIPNPCMRIRVMKSRWGSCTPKKQTVTLNRRLIEADRECIDYVILHELCHFVYADHSARFHALMSRLMPDWKIRRKRLNQSVSLTQ